MFNFNPPAPPTGKHHLETHPNPVTVAELEAQEHAEQPTDTTHAGPHTYTRTAGD